MFDRIARKAAYQTGICRNGSQDWPIGVRDDE
jgi:hypothetical protein